MMALMRQLLLHHLVEILHQVDLGKQSYVFGESTFLLTSIELPIVSRVSVASVEKPYLAFFLKLDMGIVRDVLL